MKNLFFFWAFFLWSSTLSSQILTCDLELLDINWDNETITLTLNNNFCSNSSTPFWVPSSDSVYVMQLGFSFEGTTCLIPSTAFTMFYPPLGLNDTITYYFGEWNDPFNCFNSAFISYQETCTVTVSAVGANNSINLDLIGNNDYIAFNPVFDNCYGNVDVGVYTQDIPQYTQNITHYVYNLYGELIFITDDINNLKLNGFFIIKNKNGVKKYYKNYLEY